MKGLLGKKAGMTTVFSEDGTALPVTIVEVQPNTVLQVKTIETDGYNAIKLGAFDKKDQRATKADLGSAKKANTSAKYFTKEIRDMEGFEMGATLLADMFVTGQLVDVTGTSKGKGFQGSIKRHNFTRGPMGHGSKYHRGSGSRGTISEHVWKGKPAPGHMGHEQVTMQNLVIIDVDLENNILLIKGSIPGPNKSFVIVRDSIKNSDTRKTNKLVDVKEMEVKNELLEEAKKVGADINSNMEISEMKDIIKAAAIQKEANEKEQKELLNRAKELKLSKADKMSLEDLREAVSKGEEVEASHASAPVEDETAPVESTTEEPKKEAKEKVETAEESEKTTTDKSKNQEKTASEKTKAEDTTKEPKVATKEVSSLTEESKEGENKGG